MQLSSDVPMEIKSLLSAFNDALSENHRELATEILHKLQLSVPDHPDLPRMRKRVERLMR